MHVATRPEETYSIQCGPKTIVKSFTAELAKQWKSQVDHAARNVTSLVMHLRPDLVDLSQRWWPVTAKRIEC